MVTKARFKVVFPMSPKLKVTGGCVVVALAKFILIAQVYTVVISRPFLSEIRFTALNF